MTTKADLEAFLSTNIHAVVRFEYTPVVASAGPTASWVEYTAMGVLVTWDNGTKGTSVTTSLDQMLRHPETARVILVDLQNLGVPVTVSAWGTTNPIPAPKPEYVGEHWPEKTALLGYPCYLALSVPESAPQIEAGMVVSDKRGTFVAERHWSWFSPYYVWRKA